MSQPEQQPRPLRLLVIDEGVLGHRTLKRELEAAFETLPGVEATMVTVPQPGRLGRLLLRRRRRPTDADLHGLRWRLRWSWQARRLLKRHARQADVALVNTQAAALLLKGPMKRTPCVLSVDATIGQFTALAYGGPSDRHSERQRRLIARLEGRALRNAAAVLAWTEWNAAALRSEYDLPATKVKTFHPGIDADWWAVAARSRQPHEGPLRVLFVGNDVERKGLPTLIEAVTALDGEAVLDVVSGDPVSESDLVRVHHGIDGGTERLRERYTAADVLALPSRADAVPWAVLEGMAAGLPVVATEVGAIAELLGDSGALVPPEDPAALAAALRQLRDPERRRQLGERAEARVRERYDRATQAARIAALGDELAGSASGGVRRRTFVAVGVGAVGVAAIAPYAVLLPGQQFERLVADRLGISTALAAQLLERARAEYGELEYDARAAAFALAVRDPAATVMPESSRRKAIDGLLAPMLSQPSAQLAYAVTGEDPGAAACAGLVRSR